MAFPTTGVLDNFDRADNASSLGANWTTGPETGYGSLGIQTNRAYAAAAFKANYWNVTQFGADQEVYVTVPVMPTYRLRLYARIQGSGATLNCYGVDLISTGATSVFKILNGVRTEVDTDPEVFLAGDKIGFEVESTTLRTYRHTAGAWALINTTAGQTDVAGAGYIGMEVGDETTVRMDDFGGGTIVTSVTPSLVTGGSGMRW